MSFGKNEMEERFADLGRVAALDRLYEGTSLSRDAAFLPQGGGRVVSASRLLTEGVDFSLVYFPLKHLGGKAVTTVTGMLCAQLACPRTLCVRVGVSAKLDFSQVKELWDGICAMALEYGYTGADLDLSPSPNGLTISVSAFGEVPPFFAERSEPQSKDLLCVSGRLGSAYLGLQVLERERTRFEQTGEQPRMETYRMMIGAYLHPEFDARIVEQLAAAGITPTAACWVTRGLSDAVRSLVRGTGLGAKVYADHIPFEGNSFALGKELGIDPVSAAMNGGEDECLLLAVPILQAESFRRDFQTFAIVGHLAQSDVGAVLVSPDGLEFPMKAQGWDNPEE